MNRVRISIFCAILSCAFFVGVDAAEPFENMLIINEDNSHFFSNRTSDEMTVEGLNEFVDQYAGTAVTHLFLNPNASRANFTNSARDAIWAQNIEGFEPIDLWPQNCKCLEERDLDPYAIWIQRCREQKISPWISMRMNDLHDVDDPTNFQHSSFWVNHPDYWRVPNTLSKDWFQRALNFKFAEVRKHATDFLDVLFKRYDFDGIELDWMRFGWHLTPGRSAEEGGYLTEVVAYARKKANQYSEKRGHKIFVAVRVPTSPDAASELGMDAVAWAKEGLVDLIIPSPFWSTTDFDIPVEVWKERLEGLDVGLAPCADVNVRSYPNARSSSCSAEQLYGFAAMEKARGTTNLYLFNWMDLHGLTDAQAAYIDLLKKGFDEKYLTTVDREVPITYRDTVPEGFPNNVQIPKDTNKTPVAFTIPIGPGPTSSRGSGVVVRFADRTGIESAQFSAKLNGFVAICMNEVDATNVPDAKRIVCFVFPQAAFNGGFVEFELTQTEGEPQEVVFVAANYEQVNRLWFKNRKDLRDDKSFVFIRRLDNALQLIKKD